ncbi:porin family protein [Photobacterium profundum]|uniref:outer membrane beta-barrel protein n=1 Tax=Photobacterium profundum TaxID=74109 RepID=UPI003D10C9B0
MKKTLLAVSLLSLCVAPAFAASETDNGTSIYLGYQQAKVKGETGGNKADITILGFDQRLDNNIVVGAYIGGSKLNKNINGNEWADPTPATNDMNIYSSYSKDEVRVVGFNVGYAYDINNDWTVTPKMGISRTEWTHTSGSLTDYANGNTSDRYAEGTTHKNALDLGVDAQYQKVKFGLLYSISDAEIGGSGTDVVSISDGVGNNEGKVTTDREYKNKLERSVMLTVGYAF